jgi:hypothetical protein
MDAVPSIEDEAGELYAETGSPLFPPIIQDNDSDVSEYRGSSPESAVEAARARRKKSTLRSKSRDSRAASRTSSRGRSRLDGKPDRRTKTVANEYTEDRIRTEASKWAARFEAPSSPELVRDPNRKSASVSPRKRKASGAPFGTAARHELRARRLQGFYNDEYRLLLNEDINDAHRKTVGTEGSSYRLGASQIGSSVWTAQEKEAFFTALARLGRDNLAGIADRIGTKSRLQVREYMVLLQEGLRNEHRNGPKELDLTDLPAALEVSTELCEVLETAADALALRQERYEEMLEREKWGDDSWLLTEDVNAWIEEHLSEEGGDRAVQEVLPAAEFLNLGGWLEVSQRIFMNPAGRDRQEQNLRYLMEPGDEHGIRATAFTDFHTLATSITKRLASAAIYVATSRLRSMPSDYRPAQPGIVRKDVEQAAEMIGLPPNSYEFWRKAARRNHLDVYAHLSVDDGNGPMSYDAVEEELKVERTRPRSRSASTNRSRASSRASSIESEAFQTASESAASPTPTPTPSLPSHFASHSPPPPGPNLTSSASTAEDDPQTAYVTAFDRLASAAEETRLWELLKTEPPFEDIVTPKDETDLLNMPRPKRQRLGELEDWREVVDGRRGWEVYGSGPSLVEFERNWRRGRSRRRDGEEELVGDDEEGDGSQDGNGDGDVSEEGNAGRDGLSDEEDLADDEPSGIEDEDMSV